MCVSDYAAAEAILDGTGVAEALAGRTLVQLTNGSEEESRRQLERLQVLGARPLCGGIVGYPRHIGRPDTVILYAGSAAAFAEHEETLATLAGGQRFLGEDPALQNASYTAGFCFYFAALMGFLEGGCAGRPPRCRADRLGCDDARPDGPAGRPHSRRRTAHRDR